jgi:catechol 2,3-dioxygenase-like lactoylglutathione lyase family enzyme
MIAGIRHTGLVVVDMERALYFWRNLLGFRIVKQAEESGPHIDAMMGLKDVKVTTVKLAAPDNKLVELLQFHSHPDRPTWAGAPYSTGLTHIAMTVDDLDSVCRKLADAGVRFFAPPQHSPDGNVKVTYCQGPEGLLLELVEVLQV